MLLFALGPGTPAQEGGPLDPVLEQVTPAQEGDNAASSHLGHPQSEIDARTGPSGVTGLQPQLHTLRAKRSGGRGLCRR